MFRKTLILSLLFFMIVSANNFITVQASVSFHQIGVSRRVGNQVRIEGSFYNNSNKKVRVNYIEFKGSGVDYKKFNLNFIMRPHSGSGSRTFSISVYGKYIRISAVTGYTEL